MNLSALPELLLAWVKNQGNALLRADQQQSPGQSFRAGQVYDGKILDALATGRFLVQVAGQKLDMALPRGSQAGDTVRLTFLSGGPRPTFLLNQSAPVMAADAAQPVSLSSTAQQVQALVRLAGPAPASASGTANPSVATAGGMPTAATTGTAVSGQAAASGGLPGAVTSAPTADTSPRPGPANTVGTVTRLAGNLPTPAGTAASAPETAGQFLAGARPIVANVVMLQTYVGPQQPPPGGISPNALVGQMVEGLRAAIPSSTTLAANVLAEMPAPSTNLLPTRLQQTLSESGLFYEAHLRRWARGDIAYETLMREPQARLSRDSPMPTGITELAGMPDEAARLAGRQLQLLEGAPFLWQGLAWPGQWMEWLVEERHPGSSEGGEGGDEEAAQWQTELRLTLPRLGPIHARIGLSGDSLKLSLSTRDESVQEELRQALPSLVEGLVGAGLRLSSLSVEADLAP